MTNSCINLNLNSMVRCPISWGHLSIRRRIFKRFPLHSFYSKFGTHEFGRAVLEEQCVIKEVANWRNIFLHRCKDTNSISKFLVAEFVTFPFLLVGEKQGRDCSISCVAWHHCEAQSYSWSVQKGVINPWLTERARKSTC